MRKKQYGRFQKLSSCEIHKWKSPHHTATQPTCNAKLSHKESQCGRYYIYRVKFSSTSSLRIGAGVFAALEGPPQSNLAAGVQDFDVLKVNLTCVYGLIY